MDDYETSILKKVNNPGGHLTFDDAGYLRGLTWEAEAALTHQNIAGCISATIIYQQVTEQLLINLLGLSEFIVQLSVYPSEIQLKPKSEITFGQLIEEFNRLSIDYPRKSELVGGCKKFNEVRRFIAHKLSTENDENQIITRTLEVQSMYDGIFDLWSQGAKHYFKLIDEKINSHKQLIKG